MAELLTQLQDQLDNISRKFFETVGILQRDASPVSTSGEPIVVRDKQQQQQQALDASDTVRGMTAELMVQFKAMEQLLQLLPDNPPPGAPDGSSGSNGGGLMLPVPGSAADEAASAAFKAEMQQLQGQHEAVAGQLTVAVQEMEALLQQLQQLYAVQAQATLSAGVQQQ